MSILLRILPRFLTKLLREIELKSGIHKAVQERKIYWDSNKDCSGELINAHRILIVDDSIDTGYSMKEVSLFLKKCMTPYHLNQKIRFAAINVWSKSSAVIHTDFYTYKNIIIATPMSNDSPYHEEFLRLYNDRHKVFR